MAWPLVNRTRAVIVREQCAFSQAPVRGILLVLVGCLAPELGHASLFVWTGGGATSGWGTAANWQGNAAPTSANSTQIEFRLNANNWTPTQNLASPFHLNRLTFADTWNGGLLSGFAIAFNDDSMASPVLTLNNANQTINNNLVLNALTTLGGSSTGTLTLNGILSGPGGLNQNGAYTTFLSSANTFTGPTQILNGTVRIGNALSLQNSTVFIGVNGTLDLTGFDATIGGLSGPGNLSLGTRRLATGGNNQNTSFTGNLTGGNGGRIDHVGTGTLRLAGGNSEIWALRASSGNVRVEGGTLQVNSNTGGGDAALLASSGNLTITDGAVVSGTGAAGSSVIAQGLPAVNPLILVEGTNTRLHTFDRIILGLNVGQAGTMTVRDGGSVDTVGNLFVGDLGQGTLNVLSGGSLTASNAFIGAGGSSSQGSVFVEGVGSLLDILGNLSLSNQNVGASGSIEVVQGGQVRVGGVGSLRQGSSLVVDGGTVTAGRLTSFAPGDGSITLAAAPASALIIRDSGTAVNTFSGLLSGDGTLEMGSNGLWNLSGQNNPFTGRVLFSGGDLRVSSATALANAELDFAGAGTFRVFTPETSVQRITGSAGSGVIVLGESIRNNALRITGNGTAFDGAILGDGGSRVILDAAPSATAVLGGASATVRNFGGVISRSGNLSLAGGIWTLNSPGLGFDSSLLGDGGNIAVTGGAQVQVGNAALAIRSGVTSDLTVDGAGTSLRVLGDLLLGTTNLGAVGISRLAITNGATVQVDGRTFLQGTSFAVAGPGQQHRILGGTLSTGGLGSFGTSSNFNLRLADPTGGVALEIGRDNMSSTFGGRFVRDTTDAEATVRKIGTGTFRYQGGNWNAVNWDLAGGWTEVGTGLATNDSTITFDGGNLRITAAGNQGGNFVFNQSAIVETLSAFGTTLAVNSTLSGSGDFIKRGPGFMTVSSDPANFTGTFRIEEGIVFWGSYNNLLGNVGFHVGEGTSLFFQNRTALYGNVDDSLITLGHLTGTGSISATPTAANTRFILTTGDFHGTIGGNRAFEIVAGGHFLFGGSASLNQSLVVNPGATLELRGGSFSALSLAEVAGHVTGHGWLGARDLRFTDGSSLTALGDFTLGNNLGTAPVRFEGGSFHAGTHAVTFLGPGPVELAPVNTLGPGGRLVSGNGFLLGEGRRLTAAGAATIEGDFNNRGVVRGPGGGDFLTFENDVTGPGGFEGNIQFNALYSPGNSPAEILFEENLSLASTATLRLELGGLVPGDEYDVLRILGNLALNNSTLQIALIDNFMPSLGDAFTVLHFGSLSGSFGQFDGLDLGNGHWLESTFTGHDLTFTVVPEPSTCLLLGLAIALLAWFRRRSTAAGP